MNIITGERIQQLADHFIGEQHDFDYNPAIRALKEKQVSIHSSEFPIQNKPIIIFCYTHLLENNFAKLYALIKPFKNMN